MLRNLLTVFAMFMLLSPMALAQQTAPAPQPSGGATTVETTAPGGLSDVELKFNNKITEPTDVWVGGVLVPRNQWEWEFEGNQTKKVKIRFSIPPAKDKKVEVRVDYPGTKPTLDSAVWS